MRGKLHTTDSRPSVARREVILPRENSSYTTLDSNSSIIENKDLLNNGGKRLFSPNSLESAISESVLCKSC